MDLVFAIDTSDQTAFEVVQNFQSIATGLVQRLSIGPTNVRVAAYVYGDSAQVTSSTISMTFSLTCQGTSSVHFSKFWPGKTMPIRRLLSVR